jgi:chromosome segregation ATPase
MTKPALLLACAACLLRATAVLAAETSSEARLRDALRSATAQLRALEDERSRWQATDADQKKEIEALKAKLATASSRPAPRNNDRELQELNRKLTEAAESRDRQVEAAAECQVALREASQAARVKEDERTQLAERLGPLNDRVSVCETRNAKLFEVAMDILRRYEKMTVGEAIRAREPFTGLKRVELENLAQDSQDKLLDQRVSKQQ